MSHAIDDLINGYLDDTLSAEQFQQLNQWIKADPLHAQRFASAMLLHDRLRNEFTTSEFTTSEFTNQRSASGKALIEEVMSGQDTRDASRSEAADRRPSSITPAGNISHAWQRSAIALATTVCVVLISVALLWNGLAASSASAAMMELNRIIAANGQSLDRTFLISVEESTAQKDRGRNSPEHRRPPKPSLDHAILNVRGSNQFVLKREVKPGAFFVTGSNGTTSWAVRPDGPVRVSNDLTRFNRDLPGHERSLPINNIEDGLDALRTAYELELLPHENAADEGQATDVDERGENAGAATTRRMIAFKKRGIRGPKRVEILYTASSGQIRELRFVDMPYGRNIVTLKMTLMDEQTLAADHFDHDSHHDPKRIVEFE